MTVCAPRPLQRAVGRALAELPASFFAGLRTEYEVRRNKLCTALARAGFAVRPPEGAYYVLADYRAVLGDVPPYEAVRRLIERVAINAVPGDVFHARPDGVRTMRFHFAVAAAVLDDVCARLARLG
jgi:aminotransferase